MTTITALPFDSKTEQSPAVENGKSLADLVEAGKTALSDGDLRNALIHFETATTLHPDRPEGHNNLGAMFSSLGEFKKAEYCFDQALVLLPENSNIHYNRGIVRSRQEKFDLAREDFLLVAKSNPLDADNHNNLGVTSFMQGHLSAARKHFKKALKLNPSYTNALINLCDVEESDGRLAESVSLCEKYLAQNHDLEIRRKHLDLLSKGCQMALDEASRAAERLLVKDSSNAGARLQLGRLTQAKTALLD